MGFFVWLESTKLALWVGESLYGYPLILALHGIGMAFLVGVLLMFDVRLLGFAKGVNVMELSKLLKIAMAGLAVNLLTGIALFSASASRFITLAPFIIKIICIVIGLALTWVLVKKHIPRANTWNNGDAPSATKLLAGVSLIVWLAAIVAGRLIAYF